MKVIPVAKPIIQRDDIRAVVRVMKSGALAQGPQVEQFEKEFSKFVGQRECVAVNSGTSALHLALLSLGIGPGDEVIVPSFTFAATANSVSLTGATPVFVDIDLATYNIDPILIEAAITTRTRAIQVVHLYGLPANMRAIMQIARKHNLMVIEDAAQAHLASIDGQRVGTFGDAAAFSFYPTKNMTSGEGGMVVLNDKNQARLCRLYRNQGMAEAYMNEIVGFNLRMTDIHAALGSSQLKKLMKWTEKRQANAQFLTSRIEGVETPLIPEGFQHVFHQYTIRVNNNRDWFSKRLTEEGVGSRVFYPTEVHRLPSFNQNSHLRNSNVAIGQVLSLPVHPSLTGKDLAKIVRAVNKIAKENKFYA